MAKRLASNDPDPSDVLARIRKLIHELRILHDHLSRLEERAYTIFSDLEGLVENGDLYHIPAPETRPTVVGRPANGQNAPTPTVRPAIDRAALRRMAESGAVTIKIMRHADLSASVRIDSREAFTLAPMLADLLEILCRDGGRVTDEKVGWKSRDETRVLLSKRTGHEVTKHALTNAIYRLRSELELTGGVNPFFLQTTRTGWLRFAVLRSESPGQSEDARND